MDLTKNGFQTECNKKVEINVYALICDTPAKSFVLNIKSHNGYYSCTKCKIRGKWIVRNRKKRSYITSRGIKRKISKSGCVCFPPSGKKEKLRTDEEMAKYNPNDEFQKGENIFADIPRFGLVTCVPLDYMHLFLLGVVKRLIWLWRPRPISEYRSWKAVEFRQFLLYTGPVILKGIIKDEMFNNFLALHVATRILLSPKLVTISENIDYVEKLLENFVKNFSIIYGEKFVSPNIHNLPHICNDVKKYGVLDNFSAFKFENHMSFIKRLIRKPNQELQQLVRRSAEIEAIQTPNYQEVNPVNILKMSHSKGLLLERDAGIVKQFHKLTTNSYTINCKTERDKCILLKNGIIALILNIVKYADGKTFFIGKKLRQIDSLYKNPMDSKLFKIVTAFVEDHSLQLYPIRDFRSKMWKMELDQNVIFCPLLHVESNPIENN
ncbi:uncharacterized protein LOC122507597 [Leptopilina heterotoma]|uniref:uncharacterized protein LOC122507597 n=1 Tax=Leptopilina heterotoma TaxID=63436 RepID=UPI001CA93816|nr:uncharacterized protein LOC122507597 [Leptopilina heterotoma]